MSLNKSFKEGLASQISNSIKEAFGETLHRNDLVCNDTRIIEMSCALATITRLESLDIFTHQELEGIIHDFSNRIALK